MSVLLTGLSGLSKEPDCASKISASIVPEFMSTVMGNSRSLLPTVEIPAS